MKLVIKGLSVLLLLLTIMNLLVAQNIDSDTAPTIDVWYGKEQQVGHLGQMQSDFNLLGNVKDTDGIALLFYRLNGASPDTLTIGRSPFGDHRRLGSRGDFNADIPIEELQIGANTVQLVAVDSMNNRSMKQVRLERITNGSYPLPVKIDWEAVDGIQQVGQVVDGKWRITETGIRTVETGYDRIFLIGETNWKNYQVTVPITIHRVDQETGPRSGGNGVGVLMHFQGHAVGTYRRWPEDQPKWGYQPFGSIGWLRWNNGADTSPNMQFYRGDSDLRENYGRLLSFREGQTFWIKMQTETISMKSGITSGKNIYRWKIWAGEVEPDSWTWQVSQISPFALQQGGLILLAHHVDVTFGDLEIVKLNKE